MEGAFYSKLRSKLPEREGLGQGKIMGLAVYNGWHVSKTQKGARGEKPSEEITGNPLLNLTSMVSDTQIIREQGVEYAT